MTDADDLVDRAEAELGRPDAVYGVSPGRFRAKLLAGLGLVGYGAAANYLWWVHGPARFDHAAFWLLVAPPATGVSLLAHLVRTRGLAVLAYPAGLLRVHRGEAESYPWADVTEVRVKADGGAVEVDRDPAGGVAACWVAVEAPAFQLNKAAVTVKRADGAEAKLTPAVTGYADLAERVQRRTFGALWPGAWDRFRAGDPVGFGPFTATWAGLGSGDGVLPWADLAEVTVSGKNLTVKRAGKWLAWASHELESVPNPHVLIGLIEEAKRAARPAPGPAAEGDDRPAPG